MGNVNGTAYGLTVFSPIINDPDRSVSHMEEIRRYLGKIPNGGASPFAKAPGTHLARFLIMENVPYEGTPHVEEHLQSSYLIFTSCFDGTLDPYLDAMADCMQHEILAIWSHCVGFPGLEDKAQFRAYIKKCQMDNTFFFAGIPNVTLPEMLTAVGIQRKFVDFAESVQGKTPDMLKKEFDDFYNSLASLTPPAPGTF